MRKIQFNGLSLLVGLFVIVVATTLPALSQQAEDSDFFPQESFVQINPTLPNSRLNFDDDSQESCCAKDYSASGQPLPRATTGSVTGNSANATAQPASNMRLIMNKGDSRHLISIHRIFVVSLHSRPFSAPYRGPPADFAYSGSAGDSPASPLFSAIREL